MICQDLATIRPRSLRLRMSRAWPTWVRNTDKIVTITQGRASTMQTPARSKRRLQARLGSALPSVRSSGRRKVRTIYLGLVCTRMRGTHLEKLPKVLQTWDQSTEKRETSILVQDSTWSMSHRQRRNRITCAWDALRGKRSSTKRRVMMRLAPAITKRTLLRLLM